MNSDLKKILRAVSLELRHTLEGTYDERGDFHPGDLERRLNALGVWRDRPAKPLAELSYLSDEDKEARRVIDAYITFRAEAGVGQGEAVAEFVRESAYNWANRLLTLRCMEARGIIDEVILQKEVYGWRSMVHNRLGRRDPALLTEPDEGLFTVLFREFELQARALPNLFDPKAPAISLRPSLAALKRCIGLLSGTVQAGNQDPATGAVFSAPDALGWAYQYWNTEEKDRVFEKVRTQRGAKIEGVDIVPATQLYTEPYMVKFLVQNSLGALWTEMYPDSRLADGWEYYVQDTMRTPPKRKRLREITFLDPACGSGHFHLEAFDLLYSMYEEEGNLEEPEAICAKILNHNLFGIDIDERAVQISQAALWMKAKDYAWDLEPKTLTSFHRHFVATNIRLPEGKDHLETFLKEHPEDLPLRPALETVFEGLENAHEFGSLLQLEEPVENELRFLKEKQEEAWRGGFQSALFADEEKPARKRLPEGVENYKAWKAKILNQLRLHFEEESEAADFTKAFFGQSAGKGLVLFDILSRRYDVVAANPPYMGSKNMGTQLKKHLNHTFTIAKYDLYSAFILRCQQLKQTSGLAAVVTMHSYFYTSRFMGFREYLLTDECLRVGLHLGANAFPEMKDHVVAVCTIWQNTDSTGAGCQALIFDLRDADNKPAATRAAISGQCEGQVFSVEMSDFRSLPGHPFLYDIPVDFIRLFDRFSPLENCAKMLVREGIHSKPDDRFQRYLWEVLYPDQRWFILSSGGARQKWAGLDDKCVDYEWQARRIKQIPSPIVPSEELYLKPGLSYSDAGGSGFSCRVHKEQAIFSSTGPGIIPTSDLSLMAIMAYLNSTPICLLLDSLNPSNHYKINDLNRIPLPAGVWDSAVLESLATQAVTLKQELLSLDLTSQEFRWPFNRAGSLKELTQDYYRKSFSLQHQIISIEEKIDREVEGLLGLHKSARQYIHTKYRPNLFDLNGQSLTKNNALAQVAAFKPRNVEFNDAGAKTFVEYPAEFLAINNSISVAICSRTLLEACEYELPNYLATEPACAYISYTVLQLLGHRWPKEIDSGQSVAHQVDKDGIIPISRGGHGEDTLYKRVRERIAAGFSHENVSEIEREFAEIVGESVADWLAESFYDRHVSEFQKRPIAWQLETNTAGRGRGNPAFSCLIYFHRLDADLLPKIRSHYLRDLRKAYETEQRTLRQIATRNPDQDARLLQLDAWLDELIAFSEKLEQVSNSGFGDTPDLQTRLRQHAIDGAMQSLKAAWLRRLADVIEEEPLSEWQTLADESELHPELRDWIAVAMRNLDHHCARVGAKSPQARKLKSDPGTRALAVVIGTEARQMVEQAISLACGNWYDEVDLQILKPKLEERKAIDDEVEAAEARLAEMDGLETERYQLEKQIKALKTKSKKIRKQRRNIRKAAKELREHIEAWEYPEAATWTEWLGTQPLFDRFASSDGQKHPPSTIADFVSQESRYDPDINDGVRVNIAPLQKARLLAADVLSAKDIDRAIADRADWRADERRWCREGKLPRPGWWSVSD